MKKFGIISICIIFIGIVIGSIYLWNVNAKLKQEQQSFEKEKIKFGREQQSFKKEQATFKTDKKAFAEEVQRTKEEADKHIKDLEQAKNVQVSQTTSTGQNDSQTNSQTTSTSQNDSQTNQSNTTPPPKTNTVVSNDNGQNQNNSIIQQIAQIDSQLSILEFKKNRYSDYSKEYQEFDNQEIGLLKKKQSLLSQLK